MKSSFFVVADRGTFKAFRAEKGAADRPLRLHLVQELSLAAGHSKIGEVNTDAAGGFPSGGGRHRNSVAEKHYELENDKRATRNLAEMLEAALKQEKPTAWSLATPGELKEGILSHLPVEWRKSMVECVSRDLVHVSANDLLEHFSGARAA